MSEKELVQNESDSNNFDFEESLEKSFVILNTGDIVKGKVIRVSNTEIFVDLGYKSDGVIPKSEYSADPELDLNKHINIGDEIEVFIVRVNDGEGNVLLSKKKVDQIKGWENIEKAYKDKKVLTGKVTKILDRGIIATVEGIDILLPASQVSDKFINDFNPYLNTNIDFIITDVNKRRRRLVGSARVLIEEENKKKLEDFWNEIEVGKNYTGVVKKNMNFGSFVDLGTGIDGLIHISELAWTKIKHPSEIVKEGDTVDVYILDFDKEKNRISLGYKKNEDNPIEIAKSKFNVGDVVKCKVVRMLPFGAFVELIPGFDGLIHISQIDHKRIAKPSDVLSIGQEVEAKITELNWDEEKIALSIKELIPKEEQPKPEKKVEKKKQKKKDDIPTEYIEETTVTIGDIMESKGE